MLKSLQAPGTAPAEKPCSTLPPDQGPGRVLCSSTNWWQQLPWALLQGLPRAHASLPLPKQGPLSLYHPLLPQLLGISQAGVKGDMGLITAWPGVTGVHFISEPWFPLLQNGSRTGDVICALWRGLE